jgi:hypothetical protein
MAMNYVATVVKVPARRAMFRMLGSICALLVTTMSAFANDDESKLTFKQDGDDLLVSMTVDANNSPHVLWTHVNVISSHVIPPGGKVADAKFQTSVTVYYCVIQNRDRFVRSQKPVRITWRLVGRKKGEETYKVRQAFIPNTEELKELLPKLKALTGQSDESK